MLQRDALSSAPEAAAADSSERVHPGKQTRAQLGEAGETAASAPGERSSTGSGAASEAMGDWQPSELLGAMGLTADGQEGSPAPPAAAELVAQARQGGRPIDDAMRPQLEASLGTGVDHLRVHTGPAVDLAAKALSARAFAVGDDLFFRSGAYDPSSQEGQRLIAHEVAHTVQSSGASGGGPMTVSDPAGGAEQAADRFADSFSARREGAGEASSGPGPSPSGAKAAAPARPTPARSSGGTRISRVPDEAGARAGRYTFSPTVGWIDWGHADPTLATDLIGRVRAASAALASAGPAAAGAGEVHSPTMRSGAAGVVLSSAQVKLKLKRALSANEVLEVALSVFKSQSRAFETQQEWTDLIGKSSFAQEDLPSNLIGFYMAARGYGPADIMRICGGLSPDDSVAEFQRDHTFVRNYSWFPVLPGGAIGAWPAELSTINDSGAKALYETQAISVTQGFDSFTFSPRYRVAGRIGDTDLLVFGFGGAEFTAADDLQVRPTTRFHPMTHGTYGSTVAVQVEPSRPSDGTLMRGRGVEWPLYVPRDVLEGMSD